MEGGKQDIRDRPNKQTCQPKHGPLTSPVPSVFLSTPLLILRTSDTSLWQALTVFLPLSRGRAAQGMREARKTISRGL